MGRHRKPLDDNTIKLLSYTDRQIEAMAALRESLNEMIIAIITARRVAARLEKRRNSNRPYAREYYHRKKNERKE